MHDVKTVGVQVDDEVGDELEQVVDEGAHPEHRGALSEEATAVRPDVMIMMMMMVMMMVIMMMVMMMMMMVIMMMMVMIMMLMMAIIMMMAMTMIVRRVII